MTSPDATGSVPSPARRVVPASPRSFRAGVERAIGIVERVLGTYGPPVVFSAHGVSPEVHRQARHRGLRVVDATCPLVSTVHAEVRRADLREEWLAGGTSVGVTAGASAPPALVDEVVAALRRLGPVTVTERVTAVEDVHFSPPAIGDPR